MITNSLYIKQQIREGIAAALQNIYHISFPSQNINIERTPKDFEGDYTALIFPLLKLKLGKPEEVGIQIGNYLKANLPLVAEFSLIKGFLNLTLATLVWEDFLYFATSQWDNFLATASVPSRKILIEYLSPNTNKPLHLGHLRNGFLGASLAKILEALGHTVNAVCLYNDKGIHICKSMFVYSQNPELTPIEAGVKGDHFVGSLYVQFEGWQRQQLEDLRQTQGISKEEAAQQTPAMKAVQEIYRKWEANDPDTLNLWEKMNRWVYEGFEESFRTFGFHFDKFYYESQTYTLGKKLVYEGLQKGIFIQKADGSVVVDLTEEGLDEKILLRSDGTSVYITQDLGTAELKHQDYAPDISIYVIGNEQDYHMKVLSLVLQKLGKPYANAIYHLSYGMVDLPSGRMKTREGNVVDADDIAQEMILTARKTTEELGKTEGLDADALEKLYAILGLGALKYFLLKVDPQKRMLFNPEESIDFKGHTGTFIQYTHARIASIQRKAIAENLMPPSSFRPQITVPLERELIHLLASYPEVLIEAGERYSPALLANYIYEVARLFSHFWAEMPILRAENEAIIQTRIMLSLLAGKIIKRGMSLLGIEVPEKM
jgi:arginyl-tRNA synthetase